MCKERDRTVYQQSNGRRTSGTTLGERRAGTTLRAERTVRRTTCCTVRVR